MNKQIFIFIIIFLTNCSDKSQPFEITRSFEGHTETILDWHNHQMVNIYSQQVMMIELYCGEKTGK